MAVSISSYDTIGYKLSPFGFPKRPQRATVTNGAWHFVVATFSPTAGTTLYVDGGIAHTSVIPVGGNSVNAVVVYTNGTVNYTVQYTYDDISGTYPNALPTVFNAPVWFNHPVLTNQTGNLDSPVTTPISAVQIVVNSGAGTAMLVVVQAGRGQ